MHMRQNQWKNWVTLIAGIWLAASPWVLGHVDDASKVFYNAVATGLALAILSVADLLMTNERPTPATVKTVGTSLAVGLWELASPWILGFSSHKDIAYNALAVGVIVAIVSLWQVVERYDVTDRLTQ
jgi:hypothetical protein